MILIPQVTLKLLALFWEHVGAHELTYEGATVGEILDKFIAKYGESLDKSLYDPESKSLRQYILILLNGRNILFLKGRDTKLHEGDVIAISPPIAGGAI
ncbi:MAG TPA: MoaD family protein [Candidatus Deferrimicrobium sp.]|nr:MoaD family protein [Candidatus Deferrimicrobium sp.]